MWKCEKEENLWNKKINRSVNCVIINSRNDNIFILIHIIFKPDMKQL